ncbi:MAG: hypothetical protein A2W99_11295 [Bacteroidetes bacterium GWF2_33_16]|nr:MAG: hypothetical protein A2X00_04445 [Bacteroidetes bacterium GWE2_32_14]OFY04118.1 MAG: hypothetical protein A2W99_11295 [Bacteroidetes bacterium GWF2_33_16]
MKKILYLFTFIGLIFSACNPNEEIYEELDKVADSYNSTVQYTLLAADYTKIAGYAKADAANALDSTWAGYISSFQAFNDSFPGSVYVPKVLPSLFPAYNKGSIAIVTYNYFNDMPADFSDYSSPTVYTLDAGDYASISENVGLTGYFFPDYNPDYYIPEFLKNSIVGAAANDIYRVVYEYSGENPVISTTTEFKEGFDINLGQFDTTSVTGTQGWYRSSYAADTYAKISGYSSGNKVNEDWLISNPIILGNDASIILNFTHAIKYLNDQWSQLAVAISADYDGSNIASATWDVIDWGDVADTALMGSDYIFRNSGDIDITTYANETIYIAFKYTSSLTNAATWEISDVTIKPIKPVYAVTFEKAPATFYDYYEYTGSVWSKLENVFYLTSADYTALNVSSSRFTPTVKPQDYIPAFLKVKYPSLVAEGTTAIVVYNYYINSAFGVQVVSDEYTYTAGEWVSSFNFISTTTEQFIYSDAGWIFDPTVKFTMSSSDYQLIVDEDPIPDPSYTNNAWYYGASAYYSNFDLRLAKHVQYEPQTFTGLTEAEAVAILYPRVQEAIILLLQKKFPAAVNEVSGVPVHYLVSYQTYNSDYTRTNYQVDYLCTESASGSTPATFELQEGYPKVL